MSANNHQFLQTRNMFIDYLSGYPNPLTYAEWNKADDDDKAALLYVTFYSEITLAWHNTTTSLGIVYVSQEDAVSTVLQYLMKNVSKISEDEARYDPKYIYKICFNCLLSLWKTRSTDMKRSTCEISNEYTDGDTVVNLWDLVASEDPDIETQEVIEAVWTIIRHMGPKYEKVANYLINPGDTLHKISKSSSERPIDRLADVSVSKEEFEVIVAELREALAPYKDAILTF